MENGQRRYPLMASRSSQHMDRSHWCTVLALRSMHPRNGIDSELHLIDYLVPGSSKRYCAGPRKKDKFNCKRSHWEQLLVRIFYEIEIGDYAGMSGERTETLSFLGTCGEWKQEQLTRGEGRKEQVEVVHLPLGYSSLLPRCSRLDFNWIALPQSIQESSSLGTSKREVVSFARTSPELCLAWECFIYMPCIHMLAEHCTQDFA